MQPLNGVDDQEGSIETVVNRNTDDPGRHGFEADEEFLAMLQQVYFMYYNVRYLTTSPNDRINDMNLVAIRGKTRKSCRTGACANG